MACLDEKRVHVGERVCRRDLWWGYEEFLRGGKYLRVAALGDKEDVARGFGDRACLGHPLRVHHGVAFEARGEALRQVAVVGLPMGLMQWAVALAGRLFFVV